MAAEIGNGTFEHYMKMKDIDPKFGFDLLAQIALHKRTTIETMVGILRHHYDDGQATADMLLKCCLADLVDWCPTRRQIIVKFEITPDVQEQLDKYQFPLPMIVKPQKLHSNKDSAYLTSVGSVILKDNHHNDDVCLDHINRVNCIKFTINMDTAKMVKNQWRNLDKPKPGETKKDFERRKRAFDKYDRTAHAVIAELSAHGDTFYLTHKYDKRGRIYAQGYHVNYQGAAWNKAVIELADKEYINED